MSYSKRQLYAAGMPLGESVTRAKLGGGYICGGGGGSSSKQSSSNQDNRVAVQDGIGLSASNNNTINTWVTDGGLVSRGLDTVDKGLVGMFGAIKDTNKQAFSVVDSALDFNSESFSKLLEAQQNMFNKGEALIGQTQQIAANAYSQAHADKGGTIDQRTMIVMGVVVAVAVVAMNHKG